MCSQQMSNQGFYKTFTDCETLLILDVVHMQNIEIVEIVRKKKGNTWALVARNRGSRTNGCPF